MSKIASVSCAEVSSVTFAVRPHQLRPVASPRAEIVPFPVASASADGAWQSVGEVAALVLRRLRPEQIAEFPVARRGNA